MMKRLLLVIQITGWCCALFAQQAQPDAEAVARQYLSTQAQSLGLTPTDISNIRLTDQYVSRHNQVTHLYFVQQYDGVDVPRGTMGLHVHKGKVAFVGNGMISNLSEQVHPGQRKVTPQEAVGTSLLTFGTALRGPISIKEKVNDNNYIFSQGADALQDIPVRLIYHETDHGYILSWEVTVEPVVSGDLWNVRIDAASGKMIDRQLLTTYCTFPNHYLARPHTCTEYDAALAPVAPPKPVSPGVGDGSQYNVFAIPIESPKHGDRQLISEPADIDASPLGWHDTDGIPGAEYTTTRGNNVHAFIDRNGDSSPDMPISGGAGLVFDFPFDINAEPDTYQEAATTNLFYMNNIMHDFSWQYGFDELAGNFQQRNASGLGMGGDYVNALCQYGADQASPPLNNANFSTPSDGGNGRMRMYLWSAAAGSRFLRVESPGDVAGSYQTSTTTTEWGAAITAVPLTAEVVIVNDGSGNPTQGCNPLANGSELTGKIALIDRGNCDFSKKALHAQNEGAIGFIICNFEEGYVNMGAGEGAGSVTIPGVFISNSDCQKIRIFAGNGLTVSFVNEAAGNGPAQRDGDVDNSVIAHEYGHGISNRLTGGPSNAGCLNNYDNNDDGTSDDGEQMGEGWSDYFALVTTVRPGDTKDVPRGIATYSNGQETNGVGLRSYAYTPNMSINPLTYDDIAFQSVPHGIGTVWCSVLWDMYWALVDVYGYDDDLYHGTGGNNLAIQLVMDGMKLQKCHPGVLDGRDAILDADKILTGGANQRLLWEVFARRGMGYSADQGLERYRTDNSEAFDINPYVIKELKIVKHMTPYIQSGDEIEVELWAVNHKDEDVTGVVVTDLVPDGTSLIIGSTSMPVDIQGDMLIFEAGDLLSGDTTRITYRLASDPALFSDRYFRDDVEGDFYWDGVINDGGSVLYWQPQEFIAYSGTLAWGVEDINSEIDQSLQLTQSITLPGTRPALMFYQNYMTERFYDAGIVQVSNNNGQSWETPEADKVIRGDYTGKVPYSLFAIPRLRAWHGDSEGWVQTVVDLSDYANEDVLIRFRFAADDSISGVGWFVDDIELVDLFSYNAEACVTSVEGDEACASATREGTIVASELPVATTGPAETAFDLNVFPNPAQTAVTVGITSEVAQKAELSMVNGAGQVIWSRKVVLPEGEFNHYVDTKSLPEGFYVIRVEGERNQAIARLVIQ